MGNHFPFDATVFLYCHQKLIQSYVLNLIKIQPVTEFCANTPLTDKCPDNCIALLVTFLPPLMTCLSDLLVYQYLACLT
jgi:hypothetical protein